MFYIIFQSNIDHPNKFIWEYEYLLMQFFFFFFSDEKHFIRLEDILNFFLPCLFCIFFFISSLFFSFPDSKFLTALTKIIHKKWIQVKFIDFTSS